MNKYIPYGKQYIDEDDINAVIDVLKSDYITTGPKIDEFEKIFADYVGAKYAVAISNGTAALHAACNAAGIQEGDEVITSPITFAASANSILYCGGTPVFADIDSDTYNIDPDEIEKKITSKTKAIIAVHFTGQPCDIEKIRNIAIKNNLILIEDAAHALGAEYKGKKIGSISDMTTFSFHPVKHITTGEGGMITTNDEKLYLKLLKFRSHGIERNYDFFENKSQGSWYYEQVELGYNYRMTDIQAALGISQMKKLDKFINKRIEIANNYNEKLKDINNIITPFQSKHVKSSWHLYVIKLNFKNSEKFRKNIFEKLKDNGIGVNVHYIPVYRFPYYEKLGYKKGLCPKAEDFYNNAITIPLYPGITEEELEYIESKLIETINIIKNGEKV